MENDLKQYLEERFLRLEHNVLDRVAALDGKVAALDGRVAALDGRVAALDGRVAALDGRVDTMEHRLMERVAGRLDAVEERLKEFVRQADHDLETKIITEFHKWGRTSDMRTRQAIADTGLLGERMLNVEDRVAALERQRSGGA